MPNNVTEVEQHLRMATTLQRAAAQQESMAERMSGPTRSELLRAAAEQRTQAEDQLALAERKQSARQIDPEQLILPIDNKQILLRMCMNLFHSYQTQHNLEAMLRNIHRAGILYPENPQFQLKQASILLHLDQANQAVSLIEGWLQRYPNTPDRQRIQQWTNEIKQQL